MNCKHNTLKRSRILVITSSYPSADKDLRGTFIGKQVRSMTDRGYNMVVLTPHLPGSAIFEILDGVTIYRFPYFFPFNLQRLCGTGGMYFSFKNSVLGKIQIIPFFIMMIISAGLIIRREKIFLIHTHWIIPQGITGALWRTLIGIPHITTAHVLDLTISSNIPVLGILIKWVLKNTDSVTVNSSFTRDQVLHFSPSSLPISIIPMGMDETRIKNVKNKKPSLHQGHAILFVGRLINWKGIDTLIEAIHLIEPDYPDISLTIIGVGPERTRYEELTKKMELNSVIQFRGLVSDSELNDAYKTSDLFILPSKAQNGMVMEGLGVVLLEAIAHGVPVIGSRIGGIPDIIEDGVTGRLSEPGNAEDLAEKIEWVFGHPEESERYAEHARIMIKEKFSWDRLSCEFDKLYMERIFKPGD